MTITKSSFGSLKGVPVDMFTLRSETGVEVDLIGFAAAVRDWRVPVDGGIRSVVLGLNSAEDYAAHSRNFGAVVGRVANRIGGAWFMRRDERFALTPNQGENQIHGGAEGFGHQVWAGEADPARNAVRFSLTSPDGAMGYPGNLNVSALYILKGNRLRLELCATTDQLTPISLTQHNYFNLGLTDTVVDHTFQIESGAYTEARPDGVPTGNILEAVPGSNHYWRKPRLLRDPNGQPFDRDGNLVLDTGRDLSRPVATVVGPDKALTLQLWTDRPGLQFYNASSVNIAVPGLGGKRYGQYSGFCLEDQAFPDAVHHPHFPSIWYEPGRDYTHWCEIEIGKSANH